MMLQLQPTVEMDTPKGRGHAEVLIDYGPEADLLWVVIINQTGEVWAFRSKDVRATANISLGRTLT